MRTDELTVGEDASVAARIAARLSGEFGAVTLTAPSGFPAYVRICHPATDAGGAFVGWTEVARETVPPAEMQAPVPPAFSAHELSRERVRLPGRDYLLLQGPLSAATKIGHRGSPTWFLPQSPNLFWPADRAWCAASEIDFDSTLLGGSTELIQAILDTPTFDAWAVGPEDSFASDADKINTVAAGDDSEES